MVAQYNPNTLQYMRNTTQNTCNTFAHCNTVEYIRNTSRIHRNTCIVGGCAEYKADAYKIHMQYMRNTKYCVYFASCSASLLVKGQETLLLLVTRVGCTLRKSLEGSCVTLVVAVPRRLRLRLADCAQVIPHVVQLAHVGASEDVRAAAVSLEPLARDARQTRRVALALRATPVDELLVRHLDNQVHGENGVHPELDIRHHASVALACHCALKDLDNLLRELRVLATVVLRKDK